MIKSKKAQFAFLDIFLALFVFFFLMIVALFMWNDYSTDLENRLTYEEAVIQAFHISDILVRSSGAPTNWEYGTESLEVIGLADKDRQLTQNKVKSFADLEVDSVRILFNTVPYKYYFKITNLEDNILETAGETITGEEEVINLRRIVLYEGQEAIAEFALWK